MRLLSSQVALDSLLILSLICGGDGCGCRGGRTAVGFSLGFVSLFAFVSLGSSIGK